MGGGEHFLTSEVLHSQEVLLVWLLFCHYFSLQGCLWNSLPHHLHVSLPYVYQSEILHFSSCLASWGGLPLPWGERKFFVL